MSGLVRSARARLSTALGGILFTFMSTTASLRKPRSTLREKEIWAKITAAAMPRPMETANCNTTSAVRVRPAPGLALLFLGREATKAIAFPLAFSAFMLPIPLSFTEHIHLWLRQVATVGCEWVMPMLGIPVLAEGTTLHFASATLFVSDACSGFSTVYAALAVACLTAYSAPSLRRRLLVMVVAAPLAIGANVLRVILLSLLVAWRGAEILETFVHPLSGMLTFALALPAIFWFGQPAPAQARTAA